MTESRVDYWKKWEKSVQQATEKYLTWRKKRKLRRKAKQKKRNPVVDWIDAILSAVVIVLLINQYLLQAYQIPSPSMEPSLLVTDRIFVNKYVYGPELIPGMLKLPGPWQPERGDVVIFESPEYISSGPVIDVLQRVVYMVTLSFVDIDKDENGQPKHHFLIKRAIGMPGDRIRMNEGNVEYLTPGESTWMTEQDMKKALGFSYENVRRIQPEEYPLFRAAGVGEGLMDEKFPASADQEAAIKTYYYVTSDSSGKISNYTSNMIKLADDIYVTMWKDATKWAIEPDNYNAAVEWRMLKEGYNVPENRIFPMGDNRDNSRDARYFGPVRLEKVLGKGLFRYWPLGRFGGVR
ncbi:MAG: signal peptidase I [Spirochaetia bacterium]